MMDKLITLEDGSSVVVVEKVKFNGRLYALVVYVDTKTYQLLNTMSLFEFKINDNKQVILASIDTPEVKEEVAKLLYKKLEANANI